MDDKLPVKTAKLTSLKNLYAYGIYLWYAYPLLIRAHNLILQGSLILRIDR